MALDRFLSSFLVKLSVLALVLSSSGSWAAQEGLARRWDDQEIAVDLENASDDIVVTGGDLSLRFGRNGQLKEVAAADRTVIGCEEPSTNLFINSFFFSRGRGRPQGRPQT